MAEKEFNEELLNLTTKELMNKIARLKRSLSSSTGVRLSDGGVKLKAYIKMHENALKWKTRLDSNQIDAPEGTTFETDEVLSFMESLKEEIASKRADHVKGRAEENALKLYGVTTNLFKLSTERKNLIGHGADISVDLLSKRQQNAINMQAGIGSSNGDNDSNSRKDDEYASSEILLGCSIAVSNAACPIKLPGVRTEPRYNTWVFLDRNQIMTGDQSLVGRRRIYYDQNGGETLICSDSEEEVFEDKQEKREFVESEDVMLRLTIRRFGLSDIVLELLGQLLSRNPGEVKARYEDLVKDKSECSSKNENIQESPHLNLDAALDPFNRLFCRRCLIFDCRLHGSSQDLFFPAEKQLPWCSPDVDKDFCCPNCYRLEIKDGLTSPEFANHGENHVRPSEIANITQMPAKEHPSRTSNSWECGRVSLNAKNISENIDSELRLLCDITTASEKNEMSYEDTLRKKGFVDDTTCSQTDGDEPWTPFEKSLFEKGLEMFGRSSCMIARNLLTGFKTCWEVFQYMNNSENKLSLVSDGLTGMFQPSFKGDGHTIMDNQPRRRSGFLHRRGRARRSKFTGKSAGHNALRKRISERKDELCGHYDPCNCQAPCGKECPCVVNGTCCEKYCGCKSFKNCKNQFRGCFCGKGQCRSRQCPCFAASRECDPDVCRHCWISCGDGTLDIPPQRVDSNDCRNMKLLLKQHQRVLLGRSDVSGWGAFLKNSVGKHEYLGEYTGEIISHQEADRRGKIYDRVDSSFLFNLDEQYVLDAYRKGNKLKFANHSPDPNCYSKVISSGGDNRVGIFAKQRICAGEELFYDYHYEPETPHVWARKPKAPTTRKFFLENLMCLAGVLSCRIMWEARKPWGVYW